MRGACCAVGFSPLAMLEGAEGGCWVEAQVLGERGCQGVVLLFLSAAWALLGVTVADTGTATRARGPSPGLTSCPSAGRDYSRDAAGVGSSKGAYPVGSVKGC